MIHRAHTGISLRYICRRLLVSLLAGSVFLALAGALLAAAVSVSQRPRSLEAVIAYFLRFYEPSWHSNPQNLPIIADIEYTLVRSLDEAHARHIAFSWTLDWFGQSRGCNGEALAQAYPDIFGGWRLLGELDYRCGGEINNFKHVYWESLPLEFPRTYNFYATGKQARAIQAEAVLVDGSRERVDLVDGEYALLVRRFAPFRVNGCNSSTPMANNFTIAG